MKKVIACLLLLLYFSASGGVVLNVHYCMGDVSSVDVSAFSDDDHCDKCGMPESANSCCRSEFKVIKLDNLHKAAVAINHVPKAEAAIAYTHYQGSTQIPPVYFSQLIFNSSPPYLPAVNRNILLCTFRI